MMRKVAPQITVTAMRTKSGSLEAVEAGSAARPLTIVRRYGWIRMLMEGHSIRRAA